jgi:hypothetical protein
MWINLGCTRNVSAVRYIVPEEISTDCWSTETVTNQQQVQNPTGPSVTARRPNCMIRNEKRKLYVRPFQCFVIGIAIATATFKVCGVLMLLCAPSEELLFRAIFKMHHHSAVSDGGNK